MGSCGKDVLSQLLATILLMAPLSMLTLTLIDVQPCNALWTGLTIYIRADGSIYPLDAPITTVDKMTYILTDDINVSGAGIIIERDNIILDGASHIIEGNYSDCGINIIKRSNVTVTNVIIKSFYCGIFISRSSDISIVNNTLTNNELDGINLKDSSNNRILENNVAENFYYSIRLDDSPNNIISKNIAARGKYGIYLFKSHNNIIIENNVAENNYGGIYLADSLNNSIFKNNVMSNGDHGIFLIESSNNSVAGNIIAYSLYGIQIAGGLGNSVSGNNVTVNGMYALYIHKSSDNIIAINNIYENDYGIYLYSSPKNRIYHNNFINNDWQAIAYNSTLNLWDDGYPSGGNYWSDYVGVDLYSGLYQNESGSDGIGDAPYVIDADNIDRYPLMEPYADTTPPNTIDDYDGLWHNADFIITLTATDDISGVAETCYRINGGPVKYVSINGHPLITTEGANNTLEYWSIDNAGNEEIPHKFLTSIKLDKTAPLIIEMKRQPEDNVEPNQPVKILVNATDILSGVKSVILSYCMGDSPSWTDIPMNFNSTSGFYEDIIRVEQANVIVKYKVTAHDNAGNNIIEDNAGQCYAYMVIPEFPSTITLLALFSLATAIIVLRKRTK